MLLWKSSSTGCMPLQTKTKYIMAKKKTKKTEMMKQESVFSPKQDGQAIRCLLVTFPLRAPSVIKGSRGRAIHQNSLCSVRYTKEPLRISNGPLCLWLSTLRPIPSSPGPAWCELINHSNELTRRALAYTAPSLHSLFFAGSHTPEVENSTLDLLYLLHFSPTVE